MFHRVVFKWLSITAIALIGFLVILLLLGYLLKENEIKTTKLKVQLEQEAYQQQEKNNRKNSFLNSAPLVLSASEMSQQKIIENNLDCQSDKQCFAVHTHSQAIGCIVAINNQGAAILLKVASQGDNKLSEDRRCEKEYQSSKGISALCKNNLCSL